MAGSARPAFAAVVAGLLSGLIAAAAPTAAAAQAGPGQPPFRIFLAQGGDLVVRGDYVRVGERVVFLLPLQEEAQGPSQLVTVPAAAVDWDTTGQYAAAVRAARYAAASGPADFRRMSAEGVEIVALLDEAVSAGTDAAGDLSVSLVATTARPRALPILPDPSLQEIIARALTAARLTPVPEERLAILHAAVATLDDPHSALGAEWRAVTRAIAARDLDAETRSAAAYAELRRTALAEAAGHARRADVGGVRSVLDTVQARDTELGGRNPDQLAALRAALQAHLADARALRLENDSRLQRTAASRAYLAGARAAMDRFAASRAALDDIRSVAGPSLSVLAGLERRLQAAADDLAGHAPPIEVRPAHDLLRQAFRLAAGAAQQRFLAVRNADLRAAWDSAAAAAGALMLFDRAARSLPHTEPN